MADPDRFEQILSNLLNNAIKYNRPAGRVDLRCERQGGWVRLHVADTGRGLSAEQQARVFNPWDRVGREDSGIEGSGLGLSIARDLARAMSGDLSVASVVGEGSVFTLTLPAAD